MEDDVEGVVENQNLDTFSMSAPIEGHWPVWKSVGSLSGPKPALRTEKVLKPSNSVISLDLSINYSHSSPL